MLEPVKNPVSETSGQRLYAAAPRRCSLAVTVGSVVIGGGAPVVVQSMTNTDTADAVATVKQVQELAAAGSELVRVTVNTEDAARQVGRIRGMLDASGCHTSSTKAPSSGVHQALVGAFFASLNGADPDLSRFKTVFSGAVPRQPFLLHPGPDVQDPLYVLNLLEVPGQDKVALPHNPLALDNP